MLLDDEIETGSVLKINEKYASEYEERKKKEELSQLEDKYREKLQMKGIKPGTRPLATEEGINSTSSDSESDAVEDEDGELVTPAVEAQILKTMAEIRAGDGKIYNPKVNFFSPEELAKAETEWKAKRKAQKKD